MGEAAVAAFVELAQMEFALRLAEERLAATGEGALNEVERRHLARADAVSADCPFLRPASLLSSIVVAPLTTGEIAARLSMDCWLVDLTRPEVGLACVRAVAPDLQTYPVAWETDRLRACADRHGSDLAAAGAVELM